MTTEISFDCTELLKEREEDCDYGNDVKNYIAGRLRIEAFDKKVVDACVVEQILDRIEFAKDDESKYGIGARELRVIGRILSKYLYPTELLVKFASKWAEFNKTECYKIYTSYEWNYPEKRKSEPGFAQLLDYAYKSGPPNKWTNNRKFIARLLRGCCVAEEDNWVEEGLVGYARVLRDKFRGRLVINNPDDVRTRACWIYNSETLLWEPINMLSVVNLFAEYLVERVRGVIARGNKDITFIKAGDKIPDSYDDIFEDCMTAQTDSYSARIIKLQDNQSYRKNIFEVASGDYVARTFIDRVDLSPGMLSVRGGNMLCLKTGEMRMRTPEDYCTFELDVGLKGKWKVWEEKPLDEYPFIQGFFDLFFGFNSSDSIMSDLCKTLQNDPSWLWKVVGMQKKDIDDCFNFNKSPRLTPVRLAWLQRIYSNIGSAWLGYDECENERAQEFVRSMLGPILLSEDACDYTYVDKFFLELAAGNSSVAEYMKSLCGYLLTDEIGDRAFYMFTGGGKNGKSTLVNIMNRILGSYTSALDESILVRRKESSSGAASSHLMKLKNCRMGVLSETRDGEKLNSTLIKQITGGDEITARELHQTQTTFKSVCKLVLVTNSLPNLDINDIAILDRAKVVEFNNRFENNPNKEAEVLSKIDDFFTVLVEYAGRYYQNKKLSIPESLTKSLDKYKVSNDSFASFWSENIEYADSELKSKPSMVRSECYTLYKTYCQTNGMIAQSNQNFYKRIEALIKELPAGQLELGPKRIVGIKQVIEPYHL